MPSWALVAIQIWKARSGSDAVRRRHHQPADRRPASGRRQQVRPGHHGVEAAPADQRLLRPARRGPARVRGSAGRDQGAGEAAVHRAARDQRAAAHRRRTRGHLTFAPSADAPGGGYVRVVLGVSAGIAAYKACELLRLLTEAGHRVRVVPTPDALRFVGEATWAALSGEPVTTDAWTGVADVPHVRLGQSASLVLVAPATADLLARAAAGMAGDLLTATLLTARCPVLYAPAMHTEMWEHPATQANVSTLRSRGAIVLEPAVGRLTGKDSGSGRLPEPADLFALAEPLLAPGGRPPGQGPQPLNGRRVLISAGGTREELDPVRFLGNWSTGTPGYAFARSAAAQGAGVTLVAANVELPDPVGVKVVRVVSARDMHAAMLAEAPGADAIIMTAAGADFRPLKRADQKIKKDGT